MKSCSVSEFFMEIHMHPLKSTDIMQAVLKNSLLWVPLPHSFIPMKQKMNCSCGVYCLTYWGQCCIPELTQHFVKFTSQRERVISKFHIHITSPALYLSKALGEDFFCHRKLHESYQEKCINLYNLTFVQLPLNWPPPKLDFKNPVSIFSMLTALHIHYLQKSHWLSVKSAAGLENNTYY